MYTPTHSSAQALQRQFTTDRLETASNARILVLCYDRLDRDMLQARTAIEHGDHEAANDALGHAQDLIGELAAMLDLDAWEHARALVSVYDYLLRLLAAANIRKSDPMVAEAQRLISEIGEAFRAASQLAGSASAPTPPPADAVPTHADTPRFSVRA